MYLIQCDSCGHGGWKDRELIDGVCPLCVDELEPEEEELNK